MAATSFRKRGQRIVQVFSGAENLTGDSNTSTTSTTHDHLVNRPSYELDRIKKGMSASEVERILGQGDSDPNTTNGAFAVVNYRKQGGGIAVVYRDRRVISRAFI
jgi:hypothetical protein